MIPAEYSYTNRCFECFYLLFFCDVGCCMSSSTSKLFPSVLLTFPSLVLDSETFFALNHLKPVTVTESMTAPEGITTVLYGMYRRTRYQARTKYLFLFKLENTAVQQCG